MSTIDPGMGDPVKVASEDVEGEATDTTKDRDEEDEEDLMYPSTWWFASTACPLLAGTFGPIASGFNICALVYNWRVYIPPGGSESTGVSIPDPHWLVAINAVSLFCAVIGNATLLLNMGRRLKFSIAQPITITGFLAGGVALIADVAAINASPTYFITEPRAIPDGAHALTGAYYFAIWAAAIYIIIGLLMCVTVHGANRGYYDKDFKLTPAQRTLMLQTMSFMTYLLLGALVFGKIEGWEYLDAVYWADVTLLTIGLGDYHPVTTLGRGLLFPFAIGGVLIVGLVIGSIRSLVLERGKEKLSSRITEKRRESAIRNVNVRRQTIKISWFARADFSTDPNLSPAQRREEEFRVMRKVQSAAERERRYFALFLSSSFVLILWFVGAVVFMVSEKDQQWTYFESLYFSFVVLMTIGYGDFTPSSDAGRAFFVVWSLLAVPSLTILISNMGDTIVKWVSDVTIWIGSVTVLPGEEGVRAKFSALVRHSSRALQQAISQVTPPGIFGDPPTANPEKTGARMNRHEHRNRVLDGIAQRLEFHVGQEELQRAKSAEEAGDELQVRLTWDFPRTLLLACPPTDRSQQRNIHFYHYVLACELRNVQKDLNASPPKQYSWTEWEYFLKLMGSGQHDEDRPDEDASNNLVPNPLQTREPIGHATDLRITASRSNTSDASVTDDLDNKCSSHDPSADLTSTPSVTSADSKSGRKAGKASVNRSKNTGLFEKWSWLSEKSPLMGSKSEAEWIIERLSAALERELNMQRQGIKPHPPITIKDAIRENETKHKHEVDGKSSGNRSEKPGVRLDADYEADTTKHEKLRIAANGES